MKFRYLSILTLPVILIAYIVLPAVPSLVLGYEPEQFDHKSIEKFETQFMQSFIEKNLMQISEESELNIIKCVEKIKKKLK